MEDVDKDIHDLEHKIHAIEKEKSDVLLKFNEIMDEIGKIEFYNKTAKVVVGGESGAWRNFIIRGFPHLNKYTGRVELIIKQDKEKANLAGEIEFKFPDNSPLVAFQTDSLGNITFIGAGPDSQAMALGGDEFKKTFILKILQKILEIEAL
jgi:hypothetical protein